MARCAPCTHHCPCPAAVARCCAHTIAPAQPLAGLAGRTRAGQPQLALGIWPLFRQLSVLSSRLLQIGYDGRSVDVWASGILLLVMLLGSFPFDHTGEAGGQ